MCDLHGLSGVESTLNLISQPQHLKRLKVESQLSAKGEALKDIVSLSENISDVSRLLSQPKSSVHTNLRNILSHIALQIAVSLDCSDSAKIEHLLQYILDRVQNLLHSTAGCMTQIQKDSFPVSKLPMDEFSCQKCCELLYKPVTLSCGHTFCQQCICSSKYHMSKCIICNEAVAEDAITTLKNNVTISTVLRNWHSKEWKARSYTIEGMQLLQKQQCSAAIEKFTKTLAVIPGSHIALLHRAKGYYCLGEFEDAMRDILLATCLAKEWPEAHYVKGEILSAMNRDEDALVSLATCLMFDPEKSEARNKLTKILQKLLSCDEARSQSEDDRHAPHHTRNHSPNVTGLSSGKRKHSSGEEDAVVEPCKPCQLNTNSLSSVYAPDTNIHPPVSLHDLGLNLPNGQNEFGIPIESEKILETALLDCSTFLTESFYMNLTDASGKPWMDLLDTVLLTKKRVVPADVVDVADLECSLCMRLFYDPVCTPCGHVFCQFCIERCFDHNAQCPLCKQSMKEYLAANLNKLHPACDYVTKAITKQYLPEAYKEREEQHRQELEDLTQKQPIFVCTIAFPSVPCPLHIFEPHYRLMLRRCLSYNQREFGMCMPVDKLPHHPIGTLLKVKSVNFFPDGRSVVDSIGYRRFKTSHCEVKDGYNVAKFTYIEDQKVTEPMALNELAQFTNTVYAETESWFNRLPSNVSDKILQHYGCFPVQDGNLNTENGPNWLWWTLAVLPVEQRVKATILGKDNLKDRLQIIYKILCCLKKRQKT